MDEVTMKACYAGESDELTNLREEVERLSALCDKWNSECDEYREENKKICGEIESLRAELAQYKQDAERYRWLRWKMCDCKAHDAALTDSIRSAADIGKSALDAAIDAAMK